jgi:hypothetical protein
MTVPLKVPPPLALPPLKSCPTASTKFDCHLVVLPRMNGPPETRRDKHHFYVHIANHPMVGYPDFILLSIKISCRRSSIESLWIWEHARTRYPKKMPLVVISGNCNDQSRISLGLLLVLVVYQTCQDVLLGKFRLNFDVIFAGCV